MNYTLPAHNTADPIAYIVLELLILLWGLIAVYVMIDASKRGLGGFATVLWGLLAAVIPCIGVLIWLYFRPFGPGETAPVPRRPRRRRPTWETLDPTRCPACGAAITPETTLCPSCGIHFPPSV